MPRKTMSHSYDPRTTPVRDDLAAAALKDDFPGRRYAQGEDYQVIVDGTPVTFIPDDSARLESELIRGEIFTVYDKIDGWCWGQNRRDNYVGYVPGESLRSEIVAADHQVVTRSTHTYPAPDIKRRPTGELGMSAEVKVVDAQEGFLQIDTGEWIFARHLAGTDYATGNIIDTAYRFIGTPYVWGGRSFRGLDCSALIQIALRMAQIEAPRDSDQQAASIGTEVPMADRNDLSRIENGDLIFFPGHVGIYLEHWRFLHANAYDMRVSVHNLSDVLDRANAEEAGITTIRRVPPPAELLRETAAAAAGEDQ
jgi:cell wall-associated NlpC family hydrolase